MVGNVVGNILGGYGKHQIIPISKMSVSNMRDIYIIIESERDPTHQDEIFNEAHQKTRAQLIAFLQTNDYR